MLCLWLPFTDGTTKNYGLTNMDVVDYGTSVYDQGKLGKCRSFVGNGYLQLSNTFGIESGKDFSCCYWIKEISNNILSKFRVVYQCGNLIIGHYGNKFDIYSITGNTLDLAYVCDTTEWVHCCMTYQSSNNTVTIYINGVKCSTSQPKNLTGLSGTTALIGKRSSETYLFEGYLNDFRIYNTCLSPRQIKEISKGLICHYPLGEIDGKIGGRNLLRQSSLIGERLMCNSIEMMNSVTLMQYEEEGYHIVTPSTGNFNNGIGFRYNDFTSLNIKQGDTITFSCDIKGTSDSHKPNITLRFQANSSSGVWWGNNAASSNPVYFTPSNDNWKRISVTYTIPSDEWTSKTMWLAIHGSYESNLYVRNLKLEKSSTATSWTPAPEDDTSFYDNVIYDTSGYNHNGSVTDSTCPTWSSDTPRYKGSYYFENLRYIKGKTPWGTIPISEFTISIWINQISGGAYSTFLISNGYGGSGIWFAVNTEGSGQWAYRSSISPSYARGASIISTSTWYLFTYTFKNGLATWYLNGVKQKSTQYDGTTLTFADEFVLGNSYNGTTWNTSFNGKLSDFRIYATALDNQTIEELYEVGASVDNNGNLSTYEIEEEL